MSFCFPKSLQRRNIGGFGNTSLKNRNLMLKICGLCRWIENWILHRAIESEKFFSWRKWLNFKITFEKCFPKNFSKPWKIRSFCGFSPFLCTVESSFIHIQMQNEILRRMAYNSMGFKRKIFRFFRGALTVFDKRPRSVFHHFPKNSTTVHGSTLGLLHETVENPSNGPSSVAKTSLQNGRWRFVYV